VVDSWSPVVGSIVGGDFRVEAPLAEGGMGSVFVATQVSTGKRRALKLMHRELMGDPGLKQRFQQEARVAARIESDHVVQVVGAGFDPETGAPWIAMELLEGEHLGAAMERRGVLPRAEVRSILRELCHAVGAAHAAGVVHRDLKPENVFLAAARRSGASFMVKVLDFGIAKILADAAAMKQTAALGTPEWMAPEQTTPGTAVVPASDVWSIGLLAFYLLTGRSFWKASQRDASSGYSIMREIVMDDIPKASQRAAEFGCAHLLPTGFDTWFSHAVARDPRMRSRRSSRSIPCSTLPTIEATRRRLTPLATPGSPRPRPRACRGPCRINRPPSPRARRASAPRSPRRRASSRSPRPSCPRRDPIGRAGRPYPERVRRWSIRPRPRASSRTVLRR
jgi:serine/threonine protein kinase